MNDKERLNEIITRYKNVKPFEIYSDTGIISMIQMDEKDKDWLIARAEKVEQLEQEIERLKKFLSREQEEAQGLDEEVTFQLERLKQAQAKAERYENALKYILENYYNEELDDTGYAIEAQQIAKKALEGAE
jgi:DNA repair exonuclease SbcCD ATPase subunit